MIPCIRSFIQDCSYFFEEIGNMMDMAGYSRFKDYDRLVDVVEISEKSCKCKCYE